METGDEYETRIRTQRSAKEEFFETNPHSPIPEARREQFPGFDYFSVDPAYRFELDLHEYDETETFTVETSTGGKQEYLRWGEFRFEVDGSEESLQAFKSDPDEERLWVPFRDETSGEETYGAGRYLDLEPESHRTDDGRWLLDFNEAYNPTCAYNEAYECPLIPMDNWLDVRIEAGEKAYPGEPVEHVDHHHE